MRFGSRLLPLCVLFATVIGACSTEPFTGERLPNQAPRVWLASAPPEGDTSHYRIHLYWGGWDPDGEIQYYEYAVTDNRSGFFDPADTTGSDKWRRVFSNDSVFTFTADVLVDSGTTNPISRFQRSHTFVIRAVDTEGLSSREPAYRSFTSWTLSPDVRIAVPPRHAFNPAVVPPITTFRWQATDYINDLIETQDPDSVRYVLRRATGTDYLAAIEWIRSNPDAKQWSPWISYAAGEDSGRLWTTPPIDYGPYAFAVQAKDEAGAVTPVFDEDMNVRRILVSRTMTGPTLTLTNEYIGSVLTASLNTPIVITDLPSNVPIQFTFKATAISYGGIVSGYRYGWDIEDLNDNSQWEFDLTPFTAEEARSQIRRFSFGTHTFTVEVVDNSGSRSRAQVKVNIVQFTMERDLLVVDDFPENPAGSGIGPTQGALPSDSEHDQFWFDVLQNVEGFRITDFLEVRSGEQVPIARIAQYKNIIWDTYGGVGLAAGARPKMYDLAKFRSKNPQNNQVSAGKVQPNLIALFLRAGGHMIVCGEQPLTQVINQEFFTSSPKFPFVFKYELEGIQTPANFSSQVSSRSFVGDLSFGYFDACVNVLDLAYSNFGELRRQLTHDCGVNVFRHVDPINEGLRECVPLESGFPLLTLRPEVASSGKFYAPNVRGLKAELYNPSYFDFCTYSEAAPRRPCFRPIYGHGCLDTASIIYSAPIGTISNRHADIVADGVAGAVAASSVFLGFEPYFFNPSQVQQMLEKILFDEWKLTPKTQP